MKKEILLGIGLGIGLALTLNTLKVHAETPQERWIRIQKESNEAFMNDVEKDGNLTEEAVNSLSWGNKTKKTQVKTNKKSASNNTSSSSSYSGNPRGYVYGVDEIHITGLPTDERGYTKAGDYGKIEK